tara:strand:+ start:728 stop:1168 length:441 start_codon:yes stop_codon:yes gene_type:complete
MADPQRAADEYYQYCGRNTETPNTTGRCIAVTSIVTMIVRVVGAEQIALMPIVYLPSIVKGPMGYLLAQQLVGKQLVRHRLGKLLAIPVFVGELQELEFTDLQYVRRARDLVGFEIRLFPVRVKQCSNEFLHGTVQYMRLASRKCK